MATGKANYCIVDLLYFHLLYLPSLVIQGKLHEVEEEDG